MDDALADDPRLGSVLQDRYRILDRLADGSMGVVYLAERVQLGRRVAIKFLHASYAADPQFIQRFEREAVVMSKLTHPHCVAVTDFGVEGAPYVVMDLVNGQTLRSLLDAGPVSIDRALHITRQILAGLAHAHAQDIVHRDIKPANIMLTEATGTGDHVRILDFGLATLRSAPSSDLSQTAIVIGTPNYMSPEQTMGIKVDARSDIYSTAVVLFELVCGQKPFDGEDTFELLERHRHAPVPRLATLAPDLDVPVGLQAVFDKAMAKRPGDRYQSAMEFAEALGDLGKGPARDPQLDTTPPAEARRAGPRMTGLIAVVLLVIAAGGAWAGHRLWRSHTEPSSASDPVRAAAPVQADDDTVTATEWTVMADAGAAVLADAAWPDAGYDGGTDGGASDAGVDEDGGFIDFSLPEHEREEPVAAVEDEAADVDSAEPASTDEAESAAEITTEPVPVKADPVDSIAEAVAAIKAGRREAAIAGLLRLRRKWPKNAYVPYLLGNLYFDKRWWTVALDHYRNAIANNRNYRKKVILNKNVIRALASNKTRRKATALITRTIGRAALPHLRRAAARDKNKLVRSRAAALVKRVSRMRR